MSKARVSQLDRVIALLAGDDLPHGDVRGKPEAFFVIEREGTVIGAGGLEVFGSDALLRSVIVEQGHRGEGLGSALCDELEAFAHRSAIEAVYLLTTTAAAFFADRGYEVVDRRTAPDAVQETVLFAEACPADATCMRKRLG